jgi:uncharacterized repeat protein (TIGR03803 family)
MTCAGCALSVAALLSAGSAHAASFKVLYTFTDGNDGGEPMAGVFRDKAGNLYGTTFLGGQYGLGVVFKLAPDGTQTVLHAFDGSDGNAFAGTIMDGSGNLYGTTSYGNRAFMLAPDGTYTVLHYFGGAGDGSFPVAPLILDNGGNLYGATERGGDAGCDCGTVFRIAPDGKEKIIYPFKGGSDGVYPDAGLLLKSGELYGTTAEGGAYGYGTVFRVSKTGSETILYSFNGGSDGGTPQSSLIMDQADNLYGTASGGDGGDSNCGTVYRLAPDGTFTVLHSFGAQKTDGCEPLAGLYADAAGNFYGTTFAGGSAYAGTVYKLAPGGTETVLHAFDGNLDGGLPESVLVADRKGNLYGTTASGPAYADGTVFRVKE